MIKLVRGQDNVISLHITATYPVGEVGGTFVAKGVTIPVPQSRNGTEFKFTAADVESIGEDFMIGVMTLKNEANEEVAVVRVPLAILPEGSDNRGFTDVRITLVSIREVEGGDHGGSGVKMFPTKDDFPVPGDVRYIYLAEDTGKMYRWDAAAEDYVEVSGVVHANLAENDPEKDGYVLNRQTSFLYNDGWDGTHPYASVANFVPDYDPATTYAKNDVVFHEFESGDTTDNGIFRCLADGTTVAPPDASKWIEIDLKDLLGKKEVVVSDDGETPTGGEEIWIDETETPDGQSYNDLVDKPQINGHELTGNKTSRQLGIVDTTDLDKKLSKQRVDGDATKGQVEWEELDDHSGCLKVTGVVKGTNVETADGNHNLADKANVADLEKIIPYGYYDESVGKFYKSYDKATGTFSDEITGQANRLYVDLLTDTVWKCDPTTPPPFSKFVRVRECGPSEVKKVARYFYEASYPDIDEELGYAYMKERFPPKMGACSSLRAGSFYGRNYDFTYDNTATFLVRIPASVNRNASISVCTSEIDESEIDNKQVSRRRWELVPFHALDGINDHGVICSNNVVHADDASDAGWTGTEIAAGAMVRYVLDHAKTAAEGAQMIADKVFMPANFHGYSIHYMVADRDKTFIVESIPANTSTGAAAYVNVQDVSTSTVSKYAAMTNFRCQQKKTFMSNFYKTVNVSQLNDFDPYAAGVERYNKIVAALEDIDTSKVDTAAGMRAFLDSIWYTNAYKDAEGGAVDTPQWPSEFTGMEASALPDEWKSYAMLTVSQATASTIKPLYRDFIKPNFATRTRNGLFWQTVHSSVYDMGKMALAIKVQEEDTEYRFNLFGATVEVDDRIDNESANPVQNKVIAKAIEGIVSYGYLNADDGKFYKEQTYETEIPGNENRLYVDVKDEITYRWDGTDKKFVSMTSPVDDDFDEDSTNPVQNKKVTEKFSETDTAIAGNTANIASNLALISTTRVYTDHGFWKADAQYLASNDFVISHNETIPGGFVTKYYKCVADCMGVEPPDTDYWIEIPRDRVALVGLKGYIEIRDGAVYAVQPD